MYNKRSAAFVTGNLLSLKELYDTSQKYGQWALEHEVKCVKYLQDSHGYLLVNSHTTDRYHIPWNLGWGDNQIRFFLIHINE